ncbi:LAFE_0H14422g1_1 [Lachancea fermentati]|uniref:LAFE_0H14422g1_1 n=1 Tax=Lachancea fermentati TaxID=4955 RepID=A0A1G4MKW4_LACFM|nr:LAFE_0H14422g1_1 [Lachancea fermentati]
MRLTNLDSGKDAGHAPKSPQRDPQVDTADVSNPSSFVFTTATRTAPPAALNTGLSPQSSNPHVDWYDYHDEHPGSSRHSPALAYQPHPLGSASHWEQSYELPSGPPGSSHYFPYKQHIHFSHLALQDRMRTVSDFGQAQEGSDFHHNPSVDHPQHFQSGVAHMSHAARWPPARGMLHAHQDQSRPHQHSRSADDNHLLRGPSGTQGRDAPSTQNAQGTMPPSSFVGRALSVHSRSYIAETNSEFSSSCTDLFGPEASAIESVDTWQARRRHNSAPSASSKSTPEIKYDSMGLAKNQCPQCHKIFSRVSSLQVHSLVHTGDRPFACPWPGCIKSFNVKSNMVRHYKIHEKKVSVVKRDFGPRSDNAKCDKND